MELMEGDKLSRFAAVFSLVCVCVLLGFGSGAADAAPYSQVVDNATSGRFKAGEGWGHSSYSSGKYGKNYRYARPGNVSSMASFKVQRPAGGNYVVYVRWPANAGYNSYTPVGVKTTSGVTWRRVNQQRNGGRWVRLGIFRMSRGDDFAIHFSRRTGAKGYIIADAVRIVRASQGSTNDSSDGETRVTGRNIVAEAESWLGVPYRYGGATRTGVDCSGLTQAVYGRFGVSLPRIAADQYKLGTRVSTAGRGNLVFGNFNGGTSVEHVGIATGDGRMINAPYPGTVVRYDRIYAKYTIGIKRIVPEG